MDGSYSPSLPFSFREGNGSCRHSPLYLILNEAGPHCGACLIKDGLEGELPKKLHYTKRQLTTNGNPQQTGILLAHVQLIEGLIPPKPGQSLKQYRLAREQLETKAAHEIFPFTSALWELMGYQPILATPLLELLKGRKEPEIARQFEATTYEITVRIHKGIRTALRFVRI